MVSPGGRLVLPRGLLPPFDVIGDHLTEVNVTSPTGFRELAALGGPRLERVFVDWLERACARPAEVAA